MNQAREHPAAHPNDDQGTQIHPDFSRPLAVDTAQMDWQASPAVGVWRKRLERIGDQNPQLTTLVRFEPGSRFGRHGHPGGEEFLVLGGVFSDHSGNFQAGSYVRNPEGWSHAPWTESGCELFVKLRQFPKDDRRRVVVDTGAEGWQPTQMAGLETMHLHCLGNEAVALFQITPGATPVEAEFPLVTEILVLDGLLEAGEAAHPAGTWLRFPAGTAGIFHSQTGCRYYCKTGRQGVKL